MKGERTPGRPASGVTKKVKEALWPGAGITLGVCWALVGPTLSKSECHFDGYLHRLVSLCSEYTSCRRAELRKNNRVCLGLARD